MKSISSPICFHFYRGIWSCSHVSFRIRWYQYVHEETRTRSQKSFCLPASNFAGKLSQKTWTKKSKKYSLTLLEHYIYTWSLLQRVNKRWHGCVTNFKMKWKIQIQWNDVKYLITNGAEKSTGGSLTSKTAFCNEVRVQFKLNVKTKLQLRESLSAVFRMNSRKYFECWRKFDAEDKLENPMNIGQNQTRNLSLWFPLCKRWGN